MEKNGTLAALLSGERLKTVLQLEVTESTNAVLKKMALEGAAAGQVVMAKAQTAGRGRLGRSFHSPGGQGVYLSYLLKTHTPPEDTAAVTAWAAVAARRAVKAAAGIRADIKWVNDLVYKSRKICGILAENVFIGNKSHIIIGVGINAKGAAAELPEDIRDKAGFLSELTGEEVSLPRLEAELIKALDGLREDWPHKKAEYLAEYRAASIAAGKDVLVVGNSEKKGKAIAVNDDFSLKIRYEDGTEEDLSTGEVSVRGLYGYVPE